DVAADGLWRHRELLRQLLDADVAAFAHQFENAQLSWGQVHGRFLVVDWREACRSPAPDKRIVRFRTGALVTIGNAAWRSRSILRPVAGSADGFLPALVERFASVVVAGGFEDTLDTGLAAQLFQAAPEAGRQTSQVGGAQRGGFLHARAFDPGAEQVGLELHEEVVGHRAAVHPQRAQLLAGVLLHGIQNVAGLVGDGFQRGADDVVDLDATGQAEQRAARTWVPIGRTEAGEGGHQVDAIAVRHLGGEVFGIERIVDHLQLVAQPLHGGTAVEDRAFQRILDFTPGAAGDGGEQAVPGLYRLVAGVHQQEAAGAIGVLGLARLDAHLPE